MKIPKIIEYERKSLEENEQSLLKQREEARQTKNAKGKARKVAKKHNIPKICDNCGLDEDCIINFKDEDVYNSNPENLYYLCNPCFNEKRSNGYIKKEEYAKCTKCGKIRIFAPSLFNGKSICNKCSHAEIIENKLDSHTILFPIKIRKNGNYETPISMWYDNRGLFTSNLFNEEQTDDELELIKKFLEKVQTRFSNHKSIPDSEKIFSNGEISLGNFYVISEYSIDDFTPEIIQELSKKIEKSGNIFPVTFDHETQKVWIGEEDSQSVIDGTVYFESIGENLNPEKIIKAVQEAKKDGESVN